MSPAPKPPGIGSVLGKYELVGRLGRGTTSVVYHARHLKLKMPVAVKVLNADELAHAPQLLGQLVSEAVLLAQLNHPNVVRLWDLDDEGPFPYLVLEHVQGMTLGELIDRQGPVPIQFAFAIIRQAVEGLAEAHKLGIVHRDVKPGNLLLGLDGVVKVADLGLAFVVGDRLSRQAAEGPGDTMPAGTAAYLAPEQALNPTKVDFRADVYSLGATLYHALTSLFPFEGRTSMQVIVKHLREPLVPPRHYLPDLTEEQSDLIVRMMAKDPEERFETYDDLRQALARAVGDRRAPRPLAESFLAWASPAVA
jgi:serine/threonine protein kinase